MRVRDLGMLERAHHVHDRVDVADVAEEAVAEALALVGAAHQPGDVDDLEVLGDRALDPEHLAQPLQALVRDRTTATLGSTVVKGYSAASAPPPRERIEERRLAGVRQTDDPDLHRSLASTRPSTVPTAAPAITSEG